MACTGAMQQTSSASLLAELGWPSIKERRQFYRLTLLYKMKNNLVPNYLKELLPQVVGTQSRYPLRNSQNLITLKCRTQYRAKSFLPLSVKEWNKLPENLIDSTSIDSFKRAYKKNFFPVKNKLFSLSLGEAHKYHTRLRLNFSQLSEHLYTYHIIADPSCKFCGMGAESTRHYFLECSTFGMHRNKLFSSLLDILPMEIISTLSDNDIVKLFLMGTSDLPFHLNVTLFKLVHEFIETTKRFKPLNS